MAAFILVAVVILSAAVLADTGAPVQRRIDVDRVPPPLPENVAAYELSGGSVALAH